MSSHLITDTRGQQHYILNNLKHAKTSEVSTDGNTRYVKNSVLNHCYAPIHHDFGLRLPAERSTSTATSVNLAQFESESNSLQEDVVNVFRNVFEKTDAKYKLECTDNPNSQRDGRRSVRKSLIFSDTIKTELKYPHPFYYGRTPGVNDDVYYTDIILNRQAPSANVLNIENVLANYIAYGPINISPVECAMFEVSPHNKNTVKIWTPSGVKPASRDIEIIGTKYDVNLDLNIDETHRLIGVFCFQENQDAKRTDRFNKTRSSFSQDHPSKIRRSEYYVESDHKNRKTMWHTTDPTQQSNPFKTQDVGPFDKLSTVVGTRYQPLERKSAVIWYNGYPIYTKEGSIDSADDQMAPEEKLIETANENVQQQLHHVGSYVHFIHTPRRLSVHDFNIVCCQAIYQCLVFNKQEHIYEVYPTKPEDLVKEDANMCMWIKTHGYSAKVKKKRLVKRFVEAHTANPRRNAPRNWSTKRMVDNQSTPSNDDPVQTAASNTRNGKINFFHLQTKRVKQMGYVPGLENNDDITVSKQIKDQLNENVYNESIHIFPLEMGGTGKEDTNNRRPPWFQSPWDQNRNTPFRVPSDGIQTLIGVKSSRHLITIHNRMYDKSTFTNTTVDPSWYHFGHPKYWTGNHTLVRRLATTAYGSESSISATFSGESPISKQHVPFTESEVWQNAYRLAQKVLQVKVRMMNQKQFTDFHFDPGLIRRIDEMYVQQTIEIAVDVDKPGEKCIYMYQRGPAASWEALQCSISDAAIPRIHKVIQTHTNTNEAKFTPPKMYEGGYTEHLGSKSFIEFPKSSVIRRAAQILISSITTEQMETLKYSIPKIPQVESWIAQRIRASDIDLELQSLKEDSEC